MRYPYMSPRSGGPPRPELPTSVFGPSGTRIVWGLIDPTRPISTVPLKVARRIGILPESGVDAIDRLEAEVDVEILIGERPIRWSVPVVFDATEEEVRWGLVGFLDLFDVLLRGPIGSFSIELSGELPPARPR